MVSVATALERYRPTRRQMADWAAREPDLAGAGVGVAELRAGQLDPAVPLAVKDRRLRALIRLARTDRDALTALLACLLPLLRTLAGRCHRSLGDDAWPAAVEALCIAVRSYPLDRRPAWVARNLARAANARLRATRAREDAWAARTTGLDAHVGEPAAEDDVDVRLLLRQAVDAGVVSSAVAELIELTRIHGVPLAAVARRTGVRYEALKKRRQRGEAAVAGWLSPASAGGPPRDPRPDLSRPHHRPRRQTMTKRERPSGLTPAERSLRARMAAHHSWARTSDRSARTEPARKAAMDRYEREVDPDGTLEPAERALRAEQAMKAHMTRIALKSAQARRKRAS